MPGPGIGRAVGQAEVAVLPMLLDGALLGDLPCPAVFNSDVAQRPMDLGSGYAVEEVVDVQGRKAAVMEVRL